MISVIVNGAMGRMGRKVTEALDEDPEVDIAALVDSGVAGRNDKPDDILLSIDDYKGNADCIIDFSFHTSAPTLMDYCIRTGTPAVVATTGQTDEENKIISEASKKVAIFRSANMSVGIALLRKLVREAAKTFPMSEVEIVETHHDKKVDAPSGTALMLADAIKERRPDAAYRMGRSGECPRTKEEIGIHSLRMGNITGKHEVIFSTPTETIRLKHEAHDRALFADGAISAAKFLAGKPAGMYSMDDMMDD